MDLSAFQAFDQPQQVEQARPARTERTHSNYASVPSSNTSATIKTAPEDFQITMEAPRRKRIPNAHLISDDLDGSPTSPSHNRPFIFKQSAGRVRKIIELEDSEDELQAPPPRAALLLPRTSLSGHTLRQSGVLRQSLSARQNADTPAKKKRKVYTLRKPKAAILESDAVPEKVRTARNEVRDVIAAETRVKRERFFIAKKDYFLPLLPENNEVRKLVELDRVKKKAALGDGHVLMGVHDEDEGIVPYEELEEKPKGITATMKPYQLKGLSFMVYLQRNGLAGILGDEMGLGKTLQTLSLVQYLKETAAPTRVGHIGRPCLVVCPLSVLSSWMAEARKWTPGLKVLRFHGPVTERIRLKRIAVGEIDMQGNDTRTTTRKKNGKLAATGREVIDLDPDSEEDAAEAAGVDLVVTTYETYNSENAWFKRAFIWKYVILDEGHKIKNNLSDIAHSLQGLGAEYRLILTGTPLQNNLTELWALLHWLYPTVFTEKTNELFKKAFDLTRGKVSTTVMDDARRLLELIMIRRMKDSPGVNLNLPPKTEILLFVPLTPMQRFWYTRLITKAGEGLLNELFQNAASKEAKVLAEESADDDGAISSQVATLDSLEQGSVSNAQWEESKAILKQALAKETNGASERKSPAWQRLMNLLMQLRKCCNHPYILPQASPEPYYLGEHIVRASGKFIVLDKLITELVVKQKKKVLIFSGFTKMLDYCQDFLDIRGGDGSQFRYLRFDGQTGRARRNLGIRMFNDKKSEHRVMLISTRAGGLGINLVAAQDVIFLDSDWNPQIMLQAEARAHRIGQTRPVTIYKLCCQGTVEEQMIGRIQKKLYLSTKVTESMRNIHANPKKGKVKKARPGAQAQDDDMPQLDTSQLMSLVRRGAQALSHPEIDVNEMLDWDYQTMLQKCKDKPADIHVAGMTGNAQANSEDEKKWLSQMEQVESRIFQGKKYAKENISANQVVQEFTRADRRVGKNTTVMVDGFAVSKESMNCKDWEAVPTMAGKDPRLAEVKREKKAKIQHQEQCQICWNSGDLTSCSGCPRVYHSNCLDADWQIRVSAAGQFHCPQHMCVDCSQKTSDAGGMLYRCRWCERGYCEDCLDWSKTILIGDTLKEFELLGFGAVDQAYYIKCPACTDMHAINPINKAFCERKEIEFDTAYAARLSQGDYIADDGDADAYEDSAELVEEAKMPIRAPSRAESMTDATTLNTASGITTPKVVQGSAAKTASRRERRPETPRNLAKDFTALQAAVASAVSVYGVPDPVRLSEGDYMNLDY